MGWDPRWNKKEPASIGTANLSLLPDCTDGNVQSFRLAGTFSPGLPRYPKFISSVKFEEPGWWTLPISSFPILICHPQPTQRSLGASTSTESLLACLLANSYTSCVSHQREAPQPATPLLFNPPSVACPGFSRVKPWRWPSLLS